MGRGEYARKEGESRGIRMKRITNSLRLILPAPTLPDSDEPLVETIALDSPQVSESAGTSLVQATGQSSHDHSPPNPASYFQSHDSSAPSEPDSDAEPNLNNVNETWATLICELDDMRRSAGVAGGKGKGKKAKGNGVVLETPDMRRLKEKISKVEKEYLFSRKEAGKWLCINAALLSRYRHPPQGAAGP